MGGHKGREVFRSGAGDDVFVFRLGDGHNPMRDWRDGKDVIQIEAGARGFRQLEITERRGHVFTDYGKRGDMIRLENRRQ